MVCLHKPCVVEEAEFLLTGEFVVGSLKIFSQI